MTALPLGLNAYKRTGLPEVRLENLYPESTPTSSTGSALLTVPGMATYATRGTGAIRGLFQQDGLFSGDLFAVSGTQLYRGASLLGTIAGTDDVEFAARGGRLYILGNGVISDYDGTTLTALTFPDSAAVASIADINGILLAARQDTGRFYYMLPNTVDWTLSGADYQSAEREEDKLNCIRATADEVWMFGSSSVEPFYPTGNAEQPFQRADGRSFARGLWTKRTARELDNAMFWVDDLGRVLRDGAVVSNSGITERIRLADSLRAWTFAFDGHDFYVLDLGGQGTFLFDVSTGSWHRRTSYGADVWAARCGVQVGPSAGQAVYLGDRNNTGKIWALDADQTVDETDTEIVKVFTCAVPVQGAERVANLLLNCSVGNGAADATIGLRWSDDQAKTWCEWRYVSLGAPGAYRTRVVWRALGMQDHPGRLYEFRCADPIALRVSGSDYNAPMGGRSR